MPDRFLVGRFEIVDVQHLAGAGCFGKVRQQSLLLGQLMFSYLRPPFGLGLSASMPPWS